MDERKDWTDDINDDDGAVYIPGGHRPPPVADVGETRKINAGDFRSPARGPAVMPAPAVGADAPKSKKTPTKLQAKKTNYAIILVTTVFVGVIAAVFVFAMVFNSMREGDSGTGSGSGTVAGGTNAEQNTNDDANLPDVPLVVAPDSVQAAGLIQGIGNNRFDVYVFELNEVRNFFVEGSTELRDRVGNLRPFTLFSIGDVIELSHAPNSNTIETARLSPQVAHRFDRQGVRVEGNQLVVDGNRYNLTSSPVVRYNGQTVNISELDPLDEVTVGVFQGTYVTSIEITRSHGTVVITHNENIVNPTVSVDGTAINRALEESGSTSLQVPAGEGRLVVRGDNIEPLAFYFSLARHGTTQASFADIVYRTGIVIINSQTPDAILHIGDRWFPVNEEVELGFGTHTVLLEAVGYHSSEQEITITAEPLEISINLEIIAFTRVVTINTNPAEASVYIGDVWMGTSPLNMNLAPGRHQLRIERVGFLPISQPLDITEDGNAFFNFMLHQDPAWAFD